MPKTESALILRPSARISYGTLKRWVGEHTEVDRIAVFDQEYIVDLTNVVAPRTLNALVKKRIGFVHSRMAALVSAFGRYDSVLVLCGDDEQVITGHTAFRVLGEMLFSRHLVLIGPSIAKAWPGRGGLCHPTRVREIATLATAGTISLLTTAITLAVVGIHDVVSRMKVLP